MKKLWNQIRGVENLQDAWFVAVIWSYYYNIPLPRRIFPVSDKGWLLVFGVFAYALAIHAFARNEEGWAQLPGLAAFLFIVLSKTYWATKEQASELTW